MAKEGKAKVLNEQEFKRLILVARESLHAVRNVAIIYCSFGLGLRAKEIASLTIGDVADKNYQLLDQISLTRSMTKGEKQRHAFLTNTKIRKALQEHLDSLISLAHNKPLFMTIAKVDSRPIPCRNGFTIYI